MRQPRADRNVLCGSETTPVIHATITTTRIDFIGHITVGFVPSWTESLNLYDTIGGQYSQVRKADPRVTEMLVRELALQPGKWIADVGAGTGNYALALAERGYRVRAVEPSEVMLSQAKVHRRIQYSQGYAEELPLEDREVDAIICVNAIHHFRDLDRAVREMHRVCNGGANRHPNGGRAPRRVVLVQRLLSERFR